MIEATRERCRVFLRSLELGNWDLGFHRPQMPSKFQAPKPKPQARLSDGLAVVSKLQLSNPKK